MYHKIRIGTFSIITAVMASLFISSCNSDSSTTYNYYTYGSTAVTSFSLGNANKVLYNLDSVFFSIDLEQAVIYNAQPLPCGTNIEALIANITTDNCSTVELNFTTKHGNDTTINYLEQATDSINFANGPVVLHVVSYDELASRNYRIFVNVYDTDPDSLHWNLQTTFLPGLPDKLTETKFTETEGIYYMLGSDGVNYWLNSTEDLYSIESWNNAMTVDFGMIPKVASLTGCEGKLYILDDSDNLYCSDDGGRTWNDCAISMSYIYGAYEGTIMGARIEGTSVLVVTYPGSSEPVLQPEGFPVSGTSNLLTHYTAWEVNPLAIMVGGETIDGEKTDDVWAFDGNIWAQIGNNTLPASSGRSLFQYNIAETDSVSWRVTTRAALFSFGGINNNGEIESKLYLSKDLGVHWIEAPEDMQFPENFNVPYDADVFVQPHMLGISSRAIAPITEWLCPYIYFMGGRYGGGVLNKEIWSGVLYRYTQAPLE